VKKDLCVENSAPERVFLFGLKEKASRGQLGYWGGELNYFRWGNIKLR